MEKFLDTESDFVHYLRYVHRVQKARNRVLGDFDSAEVDYVLKERIADISEEKKLLMIAGSTIPIEESNFRAVNGKVRELLYLAIAEMLDTGEFVDSMWKMPLEWAIHMVGDNDLLVLARTALLKED